MPLTRDNTKWFHRCLYGPGILERIDILKRDDDQQQGTVTVFTLFDCRRSQEMKTGQTLQHEMSSVNRMTWHIPIAELKRVGINYLNALDRIVDKFGDYWEPQSDTIIDRKLMRNHYCCECVKHNPPDLAQQADQIRRLRENNS